MEKNQKKHQNLILKLRKNSYKLRVISVFFLLSIFSFLLSFNYEFCRIFFNQFNSIKHFLNKKAMFCFFNAILLFVAKDSGFLAFSVEQPISARHSVQDFTENSQLSPTKKITVEENQQLVLTKMIAVEAKEVEKMKPTLKESDGKLEEEEEEEEVVGEMEELGIDELNKKFEEFIERVKKGIKMEALQVVMV